MNKKKKNVHTRNAITMKNTIIVKKEESSISTGPKSESKDTYLRIIFFWSFFFQFVFIKTIIGCLR